MSPSIRDSLWSAKQWLLRQAKQVAPPALAHSEFASIAEVDDAWPPVASPFPQPHVVELNDSELELNRRHRRYTSPQVVLPAAQLFAVPNGRLFPESGLVADARGRLLLESAKDVALFRKSRTWRQLRHLGRVTATGSITTIWSDVLAANYYHFVVDCLPRLYALMHVREPVTLVAPTRATTAQRQLIDWLKPAHVNVAYSPASAPWRAERVLLSPFLTLPGYSYLRPEVVEWFRDCISRHVPDAPAADGPRRLFVSRARSASRAISNERALLAALAPLAVEPVFAEQLSLEQQAQLFRQAELIVGPHGAGLTNMLFARHAAIVELQPAGANGTDDAFPHFAGLAKSLGFPYVAVLHGYSRHPAAFEVDIARTVAAVERVLQPGQTHVSPPTPAGVLP